MVDAYDLTLFTAACIFSVTIRNTSKAKNVAAKPVQI